MAGASDGHPPAQEGGERDEEQYRSQQQHPEQQPSSSRASEDRLPSLSQCDSRDATELTARMRRQYSRASSRRTVPASVNKPTTLLGSWSANIRSFWRRQISITVDHGSARDHLALERTYLGYLRTSLALSMIGITIAQLFRLQHSATPNKRIGFFTLAKPLSCICQGAAIYTLGIGAFRTWRCQNAMVRGKAISGGFEIVALVVGSFLLLLMFFALVLTVDIIHEQKS